MRVLIGFLFCVVCCTYILTVHIVEKFGGNIFDRMPDLAFGKFYNFNYDAIKLVR